MYRIEVTRRAQRQLDKLPRQDFERVRSAIALLADQPRPPSAKKLRGSIYRLRIGPYRVIYAIYGRPRLILVGRVARKAEDTYNNLGSLFRP